MKIVQIAAAIAYGDGVEIKRTVCVDEFGDAWELHGNRWMPLPKLPQMKGERPCRSQST